MRRILRPDRGAPSGAGAGGPGGGGAAAARFVAPPPKKQIPITITSPGAILGATAMVVAAYSKLVIEEWPGSVEPPLALPIVVFAACGTVLWLGAGAWSADRRATEPSGPGDRR